MGYTDIEQMDGTRGIGAPNPTHYNRYYVIQTILAHWRVAVGLGWRHDHSSICYSRARMTSHHYSICLSRARVTSSLLIQLLQLFGEIGTRSLHTSLLHLFNPPSEFFWSFLISPQFGHINADVENHRVVNDETHGRKHSQREHPY